MPQEFCALGEEEGRVVHHDPMTLGVLASHAVEESLDRAHHRGHVAHQLVRILHELLNGLRWNPNLELVDPQHHGVDLVDCVNDLFRADRLLVG